MENKKGFTLAEILVAMAVLGILTVILLPTFLRSKPNQEMVMLKKSYYVISRAVSEIINDEDFYPDDAQGDYYSGFSNTGDIATYHGKNYQGDTKFCGLIASRLNTQSTPNCNSSVTKDSTFKNGQKPNAGHVTTADGVVWVLPINNFNRGNENSTQSIYVDVNGSGGYNCFVGSSCKAPDRFEIKVDRWGKLYVPDEISRRYLASTNVSKTYKQIAAEK